MRTRCLPLLALALLLPDVLLAQTALNAASDNARVVAYERSVGAEADLPFDPALRPFYHGVASGDPLPDGVILWTRVTPEEDGPVAVRWRVATDPQLRDVVQEGEATTDVGRDYTVKVDVRGLRPDAAYYYGFEALGARSITGRTRTAPAGAADHLRFAVVSCSNYQSGYFNAYARIAERDDLSAVVHLGDYIYEYAEGGFGYTDELGRGHEPDFEIVQLDDYRIRYSFYRLDPDLRAAHQQHPFVTVWDDHEFANNAWEGGAENHQPETEGDWEDRKASAYQAYFEWMPVRETAPNRIYRRIAFGDLVELFMLDTRIEEREKQAESDVPFLAVGEERVARADLERVAADAEGPAGDALRAFLENQAAGKAAPDSVRLYSLVADVYGREEAELLRSPEAQTDVAASEIEGGSDARRLLGEAQYAWLTGGLSASQARWRVLGNQVQMMPVNGITNADAWDGYPEERDRLLGYILQHEIGNVAVITGDIHSTWTADVPQDLDRYGASTGRGSVLGEFVTPSVSADNLDELLPGYDEDFLALLARLLNPHIKRVDLTNHGYFVLDARPERLQADWFYVETVEARTSEERFAGAFLQRDGERRVRRTSGPAPPRPDAPAPAPTSVPVATSSAAGDVPEGGLLVVGAYPNPFAAQTSIHYVLGEGGPVRITVYDLLGRQVRTVVDRVQAPGTYAALFAADGLASGTYFYRVEAGAARVTRSLVLGR